MKKTNYHIVNLEVTCQELSRYVEKLSHRIKLLLAIQKAYEKKVDQLTFENDKLKYNKQ